MTILTIRSKCLGLAVAVLVAVMLLSYPVMAQEDTNASPHWSKTSCQSCHVETAPVEGVVNLQAADAEALCESCHGGRGTAKPCRHISGVSAGDTAIPEDLVPALKNGQVVCSTCHDIVYQCKNARIEYSYQNQGFLRDRSTNRTEEYCRKCHDASAYQELNPHEGVAGNPPKATCPLCHSSIPHSDATGGIQVSFNMQQELNDTCSGCHDVRPHPRKMFSYSKQEEDEWVHLVMPSEEVLAKMRQSEASTGIVLPLDPINGEIFCATCHNPHEFKGGPVSDQPEHRLRASNICEACHEK